MSLSEALQFTLRWEGGYAHIKGDRGGETYRGVSRNAHPDWPGWQMIDDYKSVHGAVPYNKIFPKLEELVRQFYADEYWNKVRGTELPERVAIAVFDHAVHSGVPRASRALQRHVGAKVDGAIGAKTLKATWEHCDRLGSRELISYRKVWLERLARKPDQSKFQEGWANRMAALNEIIEEI